MFEHCLLKKREEIFHTLQYLFSFPFAMSSLYCLAMFPHFPYARVKYCTIEHCGIHSLTSQYATHSKSNSALYMTDGGWKWCMYEASECIVSV